MGTGRRRVRGPLRPCPQVVALLATKKARVAELEDANAALGAELCDVRARLADFEGDAGRGGSPVVSDDEARLGAARATPRLGRPAAG